MADDNDDLYADLYGDHSGAGDDDVNVDDSLYDTAPGASSSDGAAPAPAAQAPAKSSFIPAAPAPARSSFIPPASSASHTSSSPFVPSATGGESAATATDVRQSSANPSAIPTYSDARPVSVVGDSRDGSSDVGVNRGDREGSSGAPRPKERRVMPHEMPEEGKMFVGGLSWETTEEEMKRYFSQFGHVQHATIMREQATGRSRGFGFISFSDPKSVNTVVAKEHHLDGKLIDPKRAVPRADTAKALKLFVGGLPETATTDSFRTLFSQFGTVQDCNLPLDKETNKPKGYGFIGFEDESSSEAALAVGTLIMDGKAIEIKRAQSKDRYGGNPPRSAATRNGQTDGGSSTPGGGGSGQAGPISMAGGHGSATAAGGMGMAAGSMPMAGFDPQALASMFQPGAWGAGAFNPLMMGQMMGGGAAGMMGGGAGGATSGAGPQAGMGAWNPAMMGMGAGGGMMGMGGFGGMGFGGMPGMGGMGMGGMGGMGMGMGMGSPLGAMGGMAGSPGGPQQQGGGRNNNGGGWGGQQRPHHQSSSWGSPQDSRNGGGSQRGGAGSPSSENRPLRPPPGVNLPSRPQTGPGPSPSPGPGSTSGGGNQDSRERGRPSEGAGDRERRRSRSPGRGSGSGNQDGGGRGSYGYNRDANRERDDYRGSRDRDDRRGGGGGGRGRGDYRRDRY